MSFHLPFTPCNHQTHLALPLYLLCKAHWFSVSEEYRFLETVFPGMSFIWLMASLSDYSRQSVLYVNNCSVSSSFSSDEDGQERFLHQGRCRTHCPRGLYPDRGHYACLPCIANCELCTDGNICAKCQEQHKLQNGVCQTASCDIGKRKAEFLNRLFVVQEKNTHYYAWSLIQVRCRTLTQESALTVRWVAKRVPQVSHTV